MTFDNAPWMVTMKKDKHYFSKVEFRKGSAEELGWLKTVHEAEQAMIDCEA
jgi:hypothetical protein